MTAHLARFAAFFAGAGVGAYGFVELAWPWDFAALVAGTMAGGAAGMALFARLASEDQRKADLEARLYDDGR